MLFSLVKLPPLCGQTEGGCFVGSLFLNLIYDHFPDEESGNFQSRVWDNIELVRWPLKYARRRSIRFRNLLCVSLANRDPTILKTHILTSHCHNTLIKHINILTHILTTHIMLKTTFLAYWKRPYHNFARAPPGFRWNVAPEHLERGDNRAEVCFFVGVLLFNMINHNFARISTELCARISPEYRSGAPWTRG